MITAPSDRQTARQLDELASIQDSWSSYATGRNLPQYGKLGEC